MNICVYGAASNAIDERFLKTGYELGKEIAERGHSLIFGGGNTGMMGAAGRGAHENGGHITGIAPKYFNVDGILYPFSDEIIYTDTMRIRKQKLEEMSDGFIVSPGGGGTMEEFFELFTQKQLNRLKKPIVILNTDGYYEPLLDMLRHMVRLNFMSDKNLELFLVTDDIKKALDYLENHEEITVDTEELRRLR